MSLFFNSLIFHFIGTLKKTNKSKRCRIYQAFSLLNSCENTGATLIVIAPLISIIEDQLADLRLRGFRAAALSSLSSAELEECSHWCYCCRQQSFLSL